jgi:hypothetical protein
MHKLLDPENFAQDSKNERKEVQKPKIEFEGDFLS